MRRLRPTAGRTSLHGWSIGVRVGVAIGFAVSAMHTIALPDEAAAASQDPRLDQSFGVRGVVTLPGSGSLVGAVEQLADGNLLVLHGRGTAILRRLLPDGSSDPTFATAGPTPGRIEFSGRNSALAVDSQGRMIVQAEFQVRRYLPNGLKDPTFSPTPGSFAAFYDLEAIAGDQIMGVGFEIDPLTGQLRLVVAHQSERHTRHELQSVGSRARNASLRAARDTVPRHGLARRDGARRSGGRGSRVAAPESGRRLPHSDHASRRHRHLFRISCDAWRVDRKPGQRLLRRGVGCRRTDPRRWWSRPSPFAGGRPVHE